LAKQTSTPPLTKVLTRLSAPFIAAPNHLKEMRRHPRPVAPAHQVFERTGQFRPANVPFLFFICSQLSSTFEVIKERKS
jgi:hypothetical protein